MQQSVRANHLNSDLCKLLNGGDSGLLYTLI